MTSQTSIEKYQLDGKKRSSKNQNFENLNLCDHYKVTGVFNSSVKNESCIDKVNSKWKSYNSDVCNSKSLLSTNKWKMDSMQYSDKFSKETFIGSENKFEVGSRKQIKEKSSTQKSSTLSLHIAAYENSKEGADSDEKNDATSKKLKTSYAKNMRESIKNKFANFSNSTSFEIPRQQKEDERNEPEIMRFKASQKLFNTGEASSSFDKELSSNQKANSSDEEVVSKKCNKKVKRGKTHFFRYNKKKTPPSQPKKYVHLTEADKGRIAGLHEFIGSDGRKIKTSEIWEANKNRGWSKRNTYKEVERLNEREGETHRKPGSGRPRTARTSVHIENIAAQKNEKSLRQMGNEEGISYGSVRNILKKDLQRRALKKTKVHLLKPGQKYVRRLRCLRLLQNYREKWQKIIFSDEKYFQLIPPKNVQNERIWVPKNIKKRDVTPERILAENNKWGRKLMIWAGISAKGPVFLKIFEEGVTMRNENYCDMICGNEFMNAADKLYPDGWILQQDGAPPHRHHSTINLLREKGIDFIDTEEWPPYSPDIAPCDYRLWAWLIQKVYFRRPPCESTEELVERITHAFWHDLTPKLCKTWISEWIPRIEKCIELDGGHIEQYFRKQ